MQTPFDQEIEEFTRETLMCEFILQRTKPDGDCLIWTSSTCNGYPTIKVGKKNLYVRSIVFKAAGKTKRTTDKITCQCENRLCVSPLCMRAKTSSAILKASAMRGVWGSASHSLKISMTRRSTPGLTKLNMDIAREVRSSPEPSKVLAQRYGVNKSLINRIRSNGLWRDHANPYMSLCR